MKVQVIVLAVLLGIALAEETKSDDLIAAESGPHYDYYPAPHSAGHSSGHGYNSHGHLSKAHDSHGHGHYDDHAVDEKSGYGKHGSHLISSYGDHGSHGDHGEHKDHFGKHTAYVKNSGHGYEKAYSYDKQVHLHDVDAHKSGHHDSHADHGHHGYKSKFCCSCLCAQASRIYQPKFTFPASARTTHTTIIADAGHHDQHGHKHYGAHDKHSSYGYGNSGHLKSDYGHQGYDKHIGSKPSYAVTYGAGHYAPVAPVYLPKAVAAPVPVYVPKTALPVAPVYAHKPVVPVYQPKLAIPVYHKSSAPGYYSYHH